MQNRINDTRRKVKLVPISTLPYNAAFDFNGGNIFLISEYDRETEKYGAIDLKTGCTHRFAGTVLVERVSIEIIIKGYEDD